MALALNCSHPLRLDNLSGRVKVHHLALSVGQFGKGKGDHDLVADINGAVKGLCAVTEVVKEVFVVR